MDNIEFKSWRTRRGLTQDQVAEELEIHRKTVSNYERGAAPIPKLVVLATQALSAPPA